MRLLRILDSIIMLALAGTWAALFVYILAGGNPTIGEPDRPVLVTECVLAIIIAGYALGAVIWFVGGNSRDYD